jgi:PAS domain S-box-containing protein
MILRASEEEFHTLAEAIPQMVWMTRPDGWNIYFNQQWEDYTGLTMEQSHGHGWLIAFHPDDKQRASDAWQNAIQKNGEYSIECRLRRADGVYHRWLIRGAPLYDKAGKVIKWFGTCTNIEDLKSAHDELQRKTLELDASLKESLQSREILENMLAENKAIREKVAQSELMFRNIFDQAGDGILIVDPESKAFYMSNKEIRRMLGYNQEEMKSLRVMDIHPEKDLPYVTEQFEKQAKKDFLLNREVPVKRKDGVVFYADINATNIMIAGKRYLMGLFHDTTERREIEDLKRMDKLKKDFISNMSHELRTPLNAVIGFSEILADQKFGPLNEVQKDYLNDVLESGKFLLSLINDILDLAKVESGKMKLELSDFSLKELLEGSLIFVKEKVLKHNIELILDIAKEVGTIRADERKVKQIVYNLLSNAVKFTLDGGKVGIKAEINGSEAKVTVWDTGIGISKEDQKKLFIAFVRLEAPLAKKYEGTGLGLSLAKDFVEMHNGKIWVESEGVRKGSSFTFTLPTGVA